MLSECLNDAARCVLACSAYWSQIARTPFLQLGITLRSPHARYQIVFRRKLLTRWLWSLGLDWERSWLFFRRLPQSNGLGLERTIHEGCLWIALCWLNVSGLIGIFPKLWGVSEPIVCRPHTPSWSLRIHVTFELSTFLQVFKYLYNFLYSK